MHTRITVVIGVVVGLALGAVVIVAQTTRTVPPTLDFTCHGYVNALVYAYNCIPAPEQQHHMRTFVPPVGSPCNEGKVITTSDQPDRIVFQIRCRDTGAPPPPAGWTKTGTGPSVFSKPIGVERVRITSRFSGSAGNFIVECVSPRHSLVVNELIGSSFGNDGTTGIYRMEECAEVEVDTEQTASWEFRQEGGRTAFSPIRSWTGVTGVGLDWSAKALASLATAVETERWAER